MKHHRIVLGWLAVVLCALPASVSAQDRRTTLFGDVGWASIGFDDSEQGKAPIYGGGVAYLLTPRLVVEGEVHGARVENVFGRQEHVFTELTFTGSVLFRAPVEGRVHLLAGGGLAVQRAHTKLDEPPLAFDRTTTGRLLHARLGADWDLTDRLVLRTHGVFWMGGGLDWVVGGRVGLGYRF